MSRSWKKGVPKKGSGGGTRAYRPPNSESATSLLEPTGGFLDLKGQYSLKGVDATSAFMEETAAPYASSHVELLDRFARGKLGWKAGALSVVLIAVWFGVSSWMVLQDNGAGRLENIQGLKHLLIKIGIYSAASLLLFGVVSLINWLSRRRESKT